jgi:hypothetical protein
VLIDGKMGESLGVFRDIAGLVGPLAMDLETARAALSWTVAEMLGRYRRMGSGEKLPDRILVVFDEFQFFAEDRGIAGLMSRIASQGRAAKVHLVLATQHPAVGCFGDPSTARELTGRLALYVTDDAASRVVIGSAEPRADHLLGDGDSYLLSPSVVHRVQGAWPEDSDFDNCPLGPPEFETWPALAGSPLENQGPGRLKPITPPEIALAVRTALAPTWRKKRRGRGYLESLMAEAGFDASGAGRLGRIVALGRDVLKELQEAPDVLIEWAGEDPNDGE